MKDDQAENEHFHHPGLLIKASNNFFDNSMKNHVQKHEMHSFNTVVLILNDKVD